MMTIDGLAAAWVADPHPFTWGVFRDAVRDFGERLPWWRHRVLTAPDEDAPRLAFWALAEEIDPTAAAFGRGPVDPAPPPRGWLEELESERVVWDQLNGFHDDDCRLTVLPQALREYPETWDPNDPVPADGELHVWFRFGFLDGAVVRIEDFFRVAPLLFGLYPVRTVHLTGVYLHHMWRADRHDEASPWFGMYPPRVNGLPRGWREDTAGNRWGCYHKRDIPPALFARLPGAAVTSGYKIYGRNAATAFAALSAACVDYGRDIFRTLESRIR